MTLNEIVEDIKEEPLVPNLPLLEKISSNDYVAAGILVSAFGVSIAGGITGARLLEDVPYLMPIGYIAGALSPLALTVPLNILESFRNYQSNLQNQDGAE